MGELELNLNEPFKISHTYVIDKNNFFDTEELIGKRWLP